MMKVFKFGGASIKDSNAFENVAKVLHNQGFESCLLVVSAIGKTTNALEKIVQLILEKNNFEAEFSELKRQHFDICTNLFPKNHQVFQLLNHHFEWIMKFALTSKSNDYNFVYDQIVSCGELLSSLMLSEFLNLNNLENQFLDVRNYIVTDNNYREANVDWETTKKNIRNINKSQSYVTQGFIASDTHFTTTLGREGSDYSAAIFANALDAVSMTIWKDVEGVMSGDPRKFQNVQLLEKISYEEAIEMAYYGASVIHPKTLQPLMQKAIPFYVKSFLNPEKSGTKIGLDEKNKLYESFILKENQILIRISSKDFSFITEEHTSFLFGQLSKWKIKVSLMQNTAISLSLCVEDKFDNLQDFLNTIEIQFHKHYQTDLALYTIRNSSLKTLLKYYKNNEVLMEQMSKNVYQILTIPNKK